MIEVFRGAYDLRDAGRPGVFAYTVPAHGLSGASRQPLLDACRQLQRILGDTGELVGQFREGRDVPDMTCALNVGARLTVTEPDKGRPQFVQYREFDRRLAATPNQPAPQAPIIAASDPASSKPEDHLVRKPPVPIPPAPEAKWRPRPVTETAAPVPQSGELLYVRTVEDGYAVVGANSQAIVKEGLRSDEAADAWIDGFTIGVSQVNS